jgi:predicted amidophosphoribosyltransferase
MFLQAEWFEITRQRRAQIVAPISVMPKRKRVGNQLYKLSSQLALRLNLNYLPLGLVERPTVRVKGIARSYQELNIT